MKSDFEILKELLQKDRSIRRFDESKSIKKETLTSLIDLCRYCASGRNLQPLKYKIISEKDMNEAIFPWLGWAGYLKEWPGPEEGERPTAYLIQCLDKNITENLLCDDGLQLQAITLGAIAQGIGACIIKSFNSKKIREILDLPDNLEITYIVALGYPVEKVVIEEMDSNLEDGFYYYRTEDKVHHVPKRNLKELIL